MARADRVLTRRRVILLPSQEDSASTTSSIANNDRTFRLLLHGVARVTDFQTACSEAAHGNRRMPFCALLPCCQTPPSPLRSVSPKSRRRFRAAHSRVGQPGSAAPGRMVELLYSVSVKANRSTFGVMLTIGEITVFCHGQLPCELPRSLCKTNPMQCREFWPEFGAEEGVLVVRECLQRF